MKGEILHKVIICILLAASYPSAMAARASDEGNRDTASRGSQTGKIIIRSVPLKCRVSFRGQDIDKVKGQITIEDIPVGVYPIAFTSEGKTLKADINVQAGMILLVNGNLGEHRVFVTPGVHVGGDGALMALIPAGEFQMGSDYGEPDEEPVHTVYLDAFYMDIYEVTNALYKKFVDATGHKAPSYWSDPKSNAPDQPVVGVTWHDAKAYCDWSGKRLPTEAEWEKAARGGLVGKTYPWGDIDDTGPPGTGTHPGVSGAYPIGNFAPNGYGLYDMSRNAWEWCVDWYGEDYYAKSPRENPKGPSSGKTRILRGGSWFAGISTPLPVSYRYSYDPERSSNLIGFRCAGTAVSP